jgi:CHAD domain-containing protein
MKAIKIPERNTLQIAADLHSDEALRLILRRELEIMAFNEACVVSHYDIECLHDFRVAMRRTRILLSRSRGVLPKRAITPFMAGFVRLGCLTGPCRDLDVMLAHWTEIAPAADAATNQVYHYLLQQRDHLRALMLSELCSPKHKQFMKSWQDFLSAVPVSTRIKYARRPIADIAGDLVGETLRNVMKKMNKIHAGSSDRKIHKLRISCKRLRYMLDYFLIFSTKSVHQKLPEQLKAIQDELGKYQDLIIQGTVLMSVDPAMTAAGLMTPELNCALLAIENRRVERTRNQRNVVLEVIAKFLSKKIEDD